MKLSISNIAWTKDSDAEMYDFLIQNGYDGIEIAPTRIIDEKPYDNCDAIRTYANNLSNNFGLKISSMQSIWYGITQGLFNSEEEYNYLVEYSKKAIRFAEASNCGNIVFGCPKNRVIKSENDVKKAVEFLEVMGEYSLEHNTCFALEANPVIYGTNFINDTSSAFDLLKNVRSNGVKVNLDLGTVIYNDEELGEIENNIDLINHVHISEPNLEFITRRSLHSELAQILKSKNYGNYVSIEMKNQSDIERVKETILYIKEIFK